MLSKVLKDKMNELPVIGSLLYTQRVLGSPGLRPVVCSFDIPETEPALVEFH